MLKVHILRTYKAGEDRFGSLCVFNTLRTGFPTAEIIVEDNTGNYYHSDWIKRIYNEANRNDTLIFLDTDVIFYDNVEPYLTNVKAPLAGRFTPNYYNEVIKANEVSRFHTSLLLMRPVGIDPYLRESDYPMPFAPFDPFSPFVFKLNGRALFYETCANLFHTVSAKDRCSFSEAFLDKYTHLISGTILKFVSGRMQYGHKLLECYARAKSNPNSVRGIWREHNAYYAEHPAQYA